MWKLIVIYINKWNTIEGNENDCRIAFEQCEYNSFVLFAFLYDDKHRLTETYLGQHR